MKRDLDIWIVLETGLIRRLVSWVVPLCPFFRKPDPRNDHQILRNILLSKAILFPLESSAPVGFRLPTRDITPKPKGGRNEATRSDGKGGER